jgi:hypothetical protein
MSDLELDWVYPPPGFEPRSLWECFHDATIESITTIVDECALILRFDVRHIRRREQFSEDQRFLLRFDAVGSVRACTYSLPPGPVPEFEDGTSVEEQGRQIKQYWERARRESVSWHVLESALKDEEVTFMVSSAELLSTDNSLALKIEGRLDDEDWFEFVVAAGQADLTDTENRGLSLDQLAEMGVAYWDSGG